MVHWRHWFALLLLLVCLGAHADNGRFDLPGPKIDVRVTRNGVSLPIASVPNLMPGDELWLHADLPASQSVHYLLIAAFLRGTTNPPPDEWFTKIETWKKDVREEGVTIKVPAEAQQAVLFLAPETGGDFSTLRSAVKGQPGVFVRASADLTESGFEQARIEKYIAEMQRVPPGDAAALQEHANLLARTLALKPNPECFRRPLDQQYTCLTQTGSGTLLSDGHGQTVAEAITSGDAANAIAVGSTTQLAGAGLYSAYVGTIVDLIHLTAGLHTAQYQYIPAIAYPKAEELNLRLNTAPSFHNPKSVIVIGLPAVQKAVPPPLRPAEPRHISCLLDPRMVLPIEGAPLVFSTELAHNLVLHLNLPPTPGAPGGAQDIPLIPDAYYGGLKIAPVATTRRELPVSKPPAPGAPAPTSAAKTPGPPPIPGAPITGTIQGMWGFDTFTGPTLPLQHDPGTGWHIVNSPETPANLIVGHPNHLQLMSTGTACVQNITLESGPVDPEARLEWRLMDGSGLQGSSDGMHRPQVASVSSTGMPAAASVGKSTSIAPLPLPVTSYEDEPAANALPVIPPIPPVDITLNLQHAATPGSIRLGILQYGARVPDQLGTKTFAEPARIDALRVHAGDTTAYLFGTSLSQVKSVTMRDLSYEPAKPIAPGEDAVDGGATAPAGPANMITLELPDNAKAPNLKANERLTAEVHLEDGRTLEVSSIVLPSRPSVSLLSRRVAELAPTPIELASPNDLPLGATLIFFLKSRNSFPRSEEIEIASVDQTLKTTLSVAANTLMLQDAHTILATFNPLKTFGDSTYGQFRLRALAADGTLGQWIPLATIVRLPVLTLLHCPAAVTQPCQLSGTGLYLIQAISAEPDFSSPVEVPEGFVDTALAVPHPTGPSFYLKLRDDPATVQTVTMPIQTDAPVPGSHTHTHPGAAQPPPPAPAVPPAASEQKTPVSPAAFFGMAVPH